MELPNFRDRVLGIVKSIPAGKVATYGSVATRAGSPRAARVVGSVLRGLGLEEREIAWWRVVNSTGYITINHSGGGIEKEMQKINLEVEGVKVSSDLRIDLTCFSW